MLYKINKYGWGREIASFKSAILDAFLMSKKYDIINEKILDLAAEDHNAYFIKNQKRYEKVQEIVNFEDWGPISILKNSKSWGFTNQTRAAWGPRFWNLLGGASPSEKNKQKWKIFIGEENDEAITYNNIDGLLHQYRNYILNNLNYITDADKIKKERQLEIRKTYYFSMFNSAPINYDVCNNMLIKIASNIVDLTFLNTPDDLSNNKYVLTNFSHIVSSFKSHKIYDYKKLDKLYDLPLDRQNFVLKFWAGNQNEIYCRKRCLHSTGRRLMQTIADQHGRLTAAALLLERNENGRRTDRTRNADCAKTMERYLNDFNDEGVYYANVSDHNWPFYELYGPTIDRINLLKPQLDRNDETYGVHAPDRLPNDVKLNAVLDKYDNINLSCAKKNLMNICSDTKNVANLIFDFQYLNYDINKFRQNFCPNFGCDYAGSMGNKSGIITTDNSASELSLKLFDNDKYKERFQDQTEEKFYYNLRTNLYMFTQSKKFTIGFLRFRENDRWGLERVIRCSVVETIINAIDLKVKQEWVRTHPFGGLVAAEPDKLPDYCFLAQYIILYIKYNIFGIDVGSGTRLTNEASVANQERLNNYISGTQINNAELITLWTVGGVGAYEASQISVWERESKIDNTNLADRVGGGGPTTGEPNDILSILNDRLIKNGIFKALIAINAYSLFSKQQGGDRWYFETLYLLNDLMKKIKTFSTVANRDRITNHFTGIYRNDSALRITDSYIFYAHCLCKTLSYAALLPVYDRDDNGNFSLTGTYRDKRYIEQELSDFKKILDNNGKEYNKLDIFAGVNAYNNVLSIAALSFWDHTQKPTIKQYYYNRRNPEGAPDTGPQIIEEFNIKDSACIIFIVFYTIREVLYSLKIPNKVNFNTTTIKLTFATNAVEYFTFDNFITTLTTKRINILNYITNNVPTNPLNIDGDLRTHLSVDEAYYSYLLAFIENDDNISIAVMTAFTTFASLITSRINEPTITKDKYNGFIDFIVEKSSMTFNFAKQRAYCILEQLRAERRGNNFAEDIYVGPGNGGRAITAANKHATNDGHIETQRRNAATRKSEREKARKDIQEMQKLNMTKLHLKDNETEQKKLYESSIKTKELEFKKKIDDVNYYSRIRKLSMASDRQVLFEKEDFYYTTNTFHNRMINNVLFVNSVKEYVNCVAGPFHTLFAFDCMTTAYNVANKCEMLFKLTSAAATTESPGNIYGYLAHNILSFSLVIAKRVEGLPADTAIQYTRIDTQYADWSTNIDRPGRIYQHGIIPRNFHDDYIKGARVVTEFINDYDNVMYNHIDLEENDIYKGIEAAHRVEVGVDARPRTMGHAEVRARTEVPATEATPPNYQDDTMPELKNYYGYYYKALQKQTYTITKIDRVFEILKTSIYLQHHDYKNYDPHYITLQVDWWLNDFDNISDISDATSIDQLKKIKQDMLDYIINNSVFYMDDILNHNRYQKPPDVPTHYYSLDTLLLMPLSIKQIIEEPINYYLNDEKYYYWYHSLESVGTRTWWDESFKRYDIDDHNVTRIYNWIDNRTDTVLKNLRPPQFTIKNMSETALNNYETAALSAQLLFSNWEDKFKSGNLDDFIKKYLKFELHVKSSLQFIYTINKLLFSTEIRYTEHNRFGEEILHYPTHWNTRVPDNSTRLGKPAIYVPKIGIIKLFDTTYIFQEYSNIIFDEQMQNTAPYIVTIINKYKNYLFNNSNLNYLIYKDILNCLLQQTLSKSLHVYELIQYKQQCLCDSLYYIDTNIFNYLNEYDKSTFMKLITLGKIMVLDKVSKHRTNMGNMTLDDQLSFYQLAGITLYHSFAYIIRNRKADWDSERLNRIELEKVKMIQKKEAKDKTQSDIKDTSQATASYLATINKIIKDFNNNYVITNPDYLQSILLKDTETKYISLKDISLVNQIIEYSTLLTEPRFIIQINVKSLFSNDKEKHAISFTFFNAKANTANAQIFKIISEDKKKFNDALKPFAFTNDPISNDSIKDSVIKSGVKTAKKGGGDTNNTKTRRKNIITHNKTIKLATS